MSEVPARDAGGGIHRAGEGSGTNCDMSVLQSEEQGDVAARRCLSGAAHCDSLKNAGPYQPPPPPPPPPPPEPPLPPPPPEPGAVAEEEMADVSELPKDEAKLEPVKPFQDPPE